MNKKEEILEKVKKALLEGQDETESYIEEISTFDIEKQGERLATILISNVKNWLSAEEVVEAFESNRSEEVLKAAKKAVKLLELYNKLCDIFGLDKSYYTFEP